MDIGSILLGAALLLVVAFIVARPLLDQAGASEREPGPADALLFERERVLTALRDLDFDHATGKLLDEDYAAQRAQLLAEGALVLRQLDEAAPGAAQTDDTDDEIEQAVARLRARPAPAAPRPAARFCRQCGQPVRPEDKFCGVCGAALAAPEARPAKAKR